jgi:hypothetical protein
MSYTQEIGRRFWFELDAATKYSGAFMNVIFPAGGFGVQRDYKDTRAQRTYPAEFRQKFLPQRDNWVRTADVQTSTVANALGAKWADIQSAFEDFGQGTLLDTDPIRQQNDDSIHTMDVQSGAPPVGYHRWHASIRVIRQLGIGDVSRWENFDKMLGLAGGIQSFARPVQQNTPNPAIAQADLQQLRNAWLDLTPDQRDRQYDLPPGDGGYHPSPKQPVVQQPAMV